MAAVAGLGFLLAMVILYLTWMNRKSMVIRSASPTFCLLIIAGCALGFSLVWALAPEVSDAVCVLSPFWAHTAFSVGFSSLLVKSYRLFRIFTSKLKVQYGLSDSRMLIVVASYTLAIIAYIAVWMIVDAPRKVRSPRLG